MSAEGAAAQHLELPGGKDRLGCSRGRGSWPSFSGTGLAESEPVYTWATKEVLTREAQEESEGARADL